jgi:hypothetical protein
LSLIKSLRKGEKRYFKLQQQQSGDENDKKFMWLFDYFEQYQRYDPKDILNKYPQIKASQLANLKTHLYKRLLESLSQYEQSGNSFINLRETVNHIQILFEKGLYDHCWKLIRRAKKMATRVQNLEMLLVILKWEKALLIDVPEVDNPRKVSELVKQVQELTQIINNVNMFSNLAIQLQALTVKSNFARNDAEKEKVTVLVERGLQNLSTKNLSFQERLHYYELYAHYYHFIQNFTNSYSYANQWVNLFDEYPRMKKQEIESYVNGLSTMMKNQVRLQLPRPLEKSMKKVEMLRTQSDLSEALRNKLVKYRFTYTFHYFFILGEFSNGVRWFQQNETDFYGIDSLLDKPSQMVLYYQLASLYFGSSNYRVSLMWLNKIINMPGQEIEEDILSFARILSLICHYELNNLDVLDSYLRSVYRFHIQKKDLYMYQKLIMTFLKKLNVDMSDEELWYEFKVLKDQMGKIVNKPYERRAFYYFDIISWLESKLKNIPVEKIIAAKSKNRVGSNL